MKAIFTILLTSLFFTLFAQEKYIDKNNEVQIWGNITIEELESPDFSFWYLESLLGFNVTKDARVAAAMAEIEVILFLGTWCSDSQDWVPKFVKIWKTYGLDINKITMIAVHNDDDKYKQSPDRAEIKYNIESVPTFIFLRKGEEIGRIVEYPQTTLEEDMKAIALGLN